MRKRTASAIGSVFLFKLAITRKRLSHVSESVNNKSVGLLKFKTLIMFRCNFSECPFICRKGSEFGKHYEEAHDFKDGDRFPCPI